MSALGSLVVKLALEYAEYTKGLDKSSQESLKFAQNTQNHFKTAASSSKEFFVGMAQGAAGVAAAYLSVGAVIDKLNASIDTLAELDDMAQKTGSSVENLSRLQKVAAMTGAEFGKVDSALIKLAKGMAAVDDDTNKTNKALAALGLTSKDAAGQLRDPSEVMADLAKKLQGYEDGAAKAALATDLFGKSGADLLPYLNDVAENVDQFAGVSSQAAKQASELQDKMGLMRVRVSELYTSVAVDLVPSLVDFIDALNDTTSAGGSLYQDGSLSSWADDTLLGVARLIDVLKTVPALARAIGASFEVVWADIQFLAKAAIKLTPANILVQAATGGNALTDVKADLDARNKIVEDANQKYDALWNQPANGLESAVMRRIAARTGENLDARDLKLKALLAGAAQGDGANKETLNSTTGNAAQNAGIKEKTSAYDALIKSIHEKIAASELELSGYAQLSESQKESIKLNELVAIAKKEGKSLSVDEARAQIQILSANERINDENRFYVEQAKAKADASNALIKAAETEAAKQEELARTFGLSKSAIEQLDIARLEEQLSQKGGIDACTAETVALATLIDAKKRNALASASFEQQDAAKKAHEGMTAEWKKSVEQYDDIFRKGFADMVNGGQDAWSSFTKSLVTTFKTSVADQIYKMFAQPFVVKMVGSVMGLVGAGASGLASAAGSDSGGSSAGSMFSSGLSLFNGFNAAMTSAGTLGTGFLGSISGGMMGAGVGSGLTSATGLAIGESIAGVVGPSVAGALSSGMAVIAAAAPWAAAAIGAYTLGNKLFGMSGDVKTTGTSYKGSLGTSDISHITGTQQDGGWARSDWNDTWTRNLANSVTKTAHGGTYDNQTSAVKESDKAMLKSLNDGYDALKTSTSDYAKMLGINADSIKIRTDAMSFAIGKDAAETQSNIGKMFADVGDKMASDLLGPFSALKKEGEGSAAAMVRLGADLTGANAALKALGFSAYSVSIDGVKAAEGLITLFGGLQNMQAASASYYDNFYTDAEKLKLNTSMVADAFKDAGQVMPGTRDALRTMVEAAKAAGDDKSYAALIKLSASFANVVPVADAVVSAVDGVSASFKSSADILNERKSLQDQYDNLTMTSVQLLDKQRSALDGSNRSLFDQVQSATAAKKAQEDLASATAAMAQRVAGALSSLGDTRTSLEAQLMTESGDLAGAAALTRKSELDKLTSGMSVSDATKLTAQYDYNEALNVQIKTLQESKAAAVAAAQAQTQAAQAQIQAAQQLSAAWQSITDSLYGEVKRIRGLVSGDSAASYVGAQSAFAIATAQARAGDQNAAKYLPQLSQALLAMAEQQAPTLEALNRIRAVTAASLESTGQGSAKYGVKIPGFASGGDFGGGLRIVGERGPELELTGAARIFNANQTRSMLGAGTNDQVNALIEEVRQLKSVINQLLTPTIENEKNTRKMKDNIQRVTMDGEGMRSEKVSG